MRNKAVLIIFLFIILLLVFIAIFLFSRSKNQNQVCFKGNCFDVELAITAKERTYGLMFRKELDADKGMLFIFEDEKEYSFWMKNVLIPLDMVWINKEKKVVFISKNNQPCKSSGCPSVNPDKKAQYVLELNGGTVDKIDLKVGDSLIFNIKF